MPAVIASRIRALINAQQWNRPQLTDALTGAAIVIPSGADLQFELLLTEDGVNLFDYTNAASVTVELSARANPLNNNVVFAQQTPITAIQTAVTVAQFLAGTQQAVLLQVPNTSTQLAVTSGATSYTLAIYVTSTDSPPKNRPILILDIQAVDADLPLANPALPPGFKIGTKMPFVCADGQTRDATVAQAPNGRWTLNLGNPYNGPGQGTYSFFCNDNLYRDVTCVLSDGVWTLDINPAGHS
jgi:hypothetical protein